MLPFYCLRNTFPSFRFSCWLSLETGAIWAFVAPALFVIVVGNVLKICRFVYVLPNFLCILFIYLFFDPQVNIGILISVTRIISRISGENYKVHGDANAVKWVCLHDQNLFRHATLLLSIITHNCSKAVITFISCFASRLTTKAVAVLLPILGISWIFGVLTFNTHTIPFLYIFAVFNSLQVSFPLYNLVFILKPSSYYNAIFHLLYPFL